MSEVAVVRDVVDAEPGFLVEQCDDGRSDGRGAGERGRHPEGAAVDRDPLDVDHLQALGREQVTERRERVVEEVLVVDGVELDRVHEVADVRRLDHEAAVVAQHACGALQHAGDVGHVGQHVVGVQHRRPLS